MKESIAINETKGKVFVGLDVHLLTYAKQYLGYRAQKSISFVLKNGQRGDFHADLVLYYCEPNYEWSPLNQVRAKLKEALRSARISVRVIAELLNTSPSQVLRLLEEKRTPVQLQQIARIATIVGYSLKVELKEKVA
ncbi:MAG: hypothetical protein GYA55_05500 [SAR324 cluster bacterium]|uniref:Uncharacterized protein n=1 Tax=SAR324 cluster bacterium TaxID=2024889 RepID=A0A7X9IJ13_9DELT|nr:hypothetical protein [SAR324 cluster bacterium]